MKYLIDVERPIFLHFLNREAVQSSNETRDILGDLLALDIMLISHCSGMTVNISQMIEYAHDTPILIKAITKLAESNILVTTSRESSISDFLNSRQTIYRNVADRYPMYFKDDSAVQSFRIAHANAFSMTRLLRRDILEHTSTQLPLIGRRARDGDLTEFSRNIDALQHITFRQDDEAVTKASFARMATGTSLNPRSLDAVGRVFSALYVEHYAENHVSATCTGVGMPGYLDDLTLFPHYDVPLLKVAVLALGWDSVRAATKDLGAEIVARYASPEHRHFVESLHAYVHAMFAMIKGRANLFRLDHESESSVRAQLANYLASSLRQIDTPPPQSVLSFYQVGASVIEAAAKVEATKSGDFAIAWEENMPPRQKVRILVITATDTEDDAVDEAMKTAGFRGSGFVTLGAGYGELYLRGSNKEIVRVRSSAGSVGPSASELVTSDAINASGATMVVAAGICFGLRDDKHALGDVLVSEVVADYETVRLSPTETRDRGTRQPSGPKLLSAARLARRAGTHDFGVQMGMFLSGQKLVDHPGFREELKTRFPDAIAGEMEGSGITAAATRAKVEWIIIKAICDWGMGKDDKAQVKAAANAAGFAMKVIELVLDAEGNRQFM